MKIERPTIYVPNSTTEETAKEPAQLQKSPLPKTDSVEVKQNSFYNFDAPKLDASKTDVANQVPAAMIHGVPFREKVELQKTLPNGSSVESGIAKGDLGFGKTRPGANHFGIDMKGNEIRNQLNDALKLREGSQSAGVQVQGKLNLGKDWSKLGAGAQASYGDSKNGGRVYASSDNKGDYSVTEKWWTDSNGVRNVSIKEEIKYAGGIGSETTTITGKGDDKIFKHEYFDENGKLVGSRTQTDSNGTTVTEWKDGDGNLQKRTSVDKEGVSVTTYYEEGKATKAEVTDKDGNVKTYDLSKFGETNNDDKEYVDPEGGPGGGANPANLTPEDLARAEARRKGVNTTPSNTDDPVPIAIDPKRVVDPLKDPLVTDGNPEYESTVLPDHISGVGSSAKGPDTVNPNDPELGGGNTPIVIDPNRPKP